MEDRIKLLQEVVELTKNSQINEEVYARYLFEAMRQTWDNELILYGEIRSFKDIFNAIETSETI